ncbi:hypothetical protein PHYSODRAFT_519249 [Phytophthora sojae]|uniref:Reverse transcriptase zinc-binding domain-containing protein n=1 Tax=Phytophthora sojae (strain P6497) TaxID=1094619 RepID=G4ZZ56_PHYSP|nr:hypothetical protein PHYSODRAFT_519249 [Phytophthora sojae]EGZ11078.1 hypothetical protein PHYSODRAFT_519249 [Phytophthora sojae]|eukprot:XP_009533823.1 hypothetical protein PHYSODRAFT_519249 [Phytophthora sojae]
MRTRISTDSHGVYQTLCPLALKKQPFRRYKGEGLTLTTILSSLNHAAQASEWQAAALLQTPKEVWDHRGELTEYQVWVSYRIAVRQLNLYHSDRARDNSCRKLLDCQGQKETMEHLFWECPCAQVCWQKLICHWTGVRWAQDNIPAFLVHCAKREAPTLSKKTKQWLAQEHPDDVDAFTNEWKRIWRILSSICVTHLSIQRNRAVYQHEVVTIAGSVHEFWKPGLRQLRALAKRECRRVDSKIQGTRLLFCLRKLARQPSPVQPPDRYKAPALLTRLRLYQTSCNR